MHDDRDSILAEVARAQATIFTTGYTLKETGRPEFPAYAEINVHAPGLWPLVRDLCNALLPERAALLIGMKDGELHSCPYRAKSLLLAAVEPYGESLARDGFVQFGFIWQRAGVTDEVFVPPARYLKIWTTRQAELEGVLREHSIPRVQTLAFLDEYPLVTETTYHPPEMYTYPELIERVLAADAELPEA
jgi:hypothetical protein